MRLLLATTNAGKLRELAALLADIPGLQLLTPADVGPMPEVEEDGGTFAENAEKKARAYAAAFGVAALADDSGLEVDALGGRPGVHSARYAGPSASDGDNLSKLLVELGDTPFAARGARYRAVLVLVDGDRPPLVASGACEGHILDTPRGDGGFGYDPVFLPSALPAGDDRTMAELTPEEKNAISHRAIALFQLADQLRARFRT